MSVLICMCSALCNTQGHLERADGEGRGGGQENSRHTAPSQWGMFKYFLNNNIVCAAVRECGAGRGLDPARGHLRGEQPGARQQVPGPGGGPDLVADRQQVCSMWRGRVELGFVSSFLLSGTRSTRWRPGCGWSARVRLECWWMCTTASCWTGGYRWGAVITCNHESCQRT